MTMHPVHSSRSVGHFGARAALWVAVLGALLVASCSDPATPSQDAAEPEGDAAGDTATLGDVVQGDGAAADAGDAAADSKSKPDTAADAATPDVLNGKGCISDDQCKGLLSEPCRIAQCELATGLCKPVDLPDGATCAGLGSDKCKVNPHCQAGACSYQTLNCDDLNGCTDDTCVAASGCAHAESTSKLCSDGSACSVGASCAGDLCVVKIKLNCDDKNPCTDDTCDDTIGCVHTPSADNSKCDDAKKCTENDICKAGACVGVAKLCPDDGNPCTENQCNEKDPTGACSNLPLPDKFCDDGNGCTLNDVCDAAGKCAGVANCDDKNPCTDDGCPDPKAGCQHIANAIPCGPLDACSGVGVCKNAKCNAPVKDCSDGNQCTDDTCDKLLGCKVTANSEPCWDGTVCTTGDACAAGTCKGVGNLDCDDKDPCTVDKCDPLQGCTHNLAPAGTACGTGKTCIVGLCLADSCGDGICSAKEDNATCDKDCSLAGGACPISDGACLNSCKASKCAVPVKKCNDTPDCQTLTDCLVGAGSDDAKTYACLVGSSIAGLQAYLAYDSCMQAFCFQNYWSGKGCSGGGQAYSDCVGACEGSMCKLLTLGCKVSSGCSAIRSCIQACPQDANLAPCVLACKSKGNAQEALLNADLDACSTTYCQCSIASPSFPTCGL